LDFVYFSGGPRLKVFNAILEAGHRITELYANDPMRWPKVQPTIERARALKIPVHIISRRGDLAGLSSHMRGRVCFSAGFAYLFPADFIESAELCLNVHGSLLPDYAGARTLSWVIENGEQESGVTVHKIDSGMDTGAILLQRSFPLSPFETTASLARKTADIEPLVVIEALKKYEKYGERAFTQQNVKDSILYPNRIPSHSELDPSKPLVALFNKIRAAHPEMYPAHFYVDGQKVCVQMWRPDKPHDESDLI
jgi:methionyl-tRNA formyltransferase